MHYSTTRLQVSSAAALAAVGLRIVSVAAEPSGSEGSTRQLVAAAAAHPTASYVSTWAEMLCFLLVALACITLTGLVPPGRGQRLAVAGGWLNTVSSLGLGFGLTIAFAPVALTGLHQDSRTVRAIDAVDASPAMLPMLALLTLGLLFPVVQGVGLARAHLVGWWYVGLTVLQAATFLVLGGEHGLVLNLVGLVPFAAVLLTWARQLHLAADPAVVERPEPALAQGITP